MTVQPLREYRAAFEDMRSSNPCGRITTLKRRADFQWARKGVRWATAGFVLEARRRELDTGGQSPCSARFGFTVTRQVGKAVERNRIRRRLKAAVGRVQMAHAKADFDYVLIARRAALHSAFDTLVNDLANALDRVHRGRGRRA
jgi:ribonuclease P protein component